MTVRGVPAPQLYSPSVYWEDRARRFAAEGDGLAAASYIAGSVFLGLLAVRLGIRLAKMM